MKYFRRDWRKRRGQLIIKGTDYTVKEVALDWIACGTKSALYNFDISREQLDAVKVYYRSWKK